MNHKTQSLLTGLFLGAAIPFSLALHASLFSVTLRKFCQLLLGINP
jgi:hypothetical protein